MLSRIKTIKNVGRFINCQSAGKAFGADTLIYGKNTQGKSTITAILRSLQEGKTDLIIGRKTFGECGDQEVSLVFDNNGTNEECHFPSEQWKAGRADILIFDNKFISDNVYEGDRVTFDNQKELHQMLLGEEGRTIKKEVDDLQERSKQLESERRQAGYDFQSDVGAKYQIALEAFVKLIPIPDVEDKIIETEREIRVLQNKQTILEILNRHIRSLEQVDFAEAKTVLSAAISVNPTQIEEHIARTWKDSEHTKHFLQEGLALTKSDKKSCVFCGQNLTTEALDLLAVYENFFQQGYEKLQTEVTALRVRFAAFNAEAIMRQIQGELSDHGLSSGLTEEQIQNVGKEKGALDAEIHQKGRNLQYGANLATVDTLDRSIVSVKDTLNKLRTGLMQTDDMKRLAELAAALKDLRLRALRVSEKWTEYCNKLAVMEKEAEEVRTTRDRKREELQKYAIQIYDLHKKTVNAFLEEMDADFRIREMTPLKKLTGKEERVFSLVFFDIFPVNIAEERPTLPAFCNTLSDSDKRVLAFAFFLSLVAHDPNIDKKIVVFDDPISSLDDERKRKSIHLLADVGYIETNSAGESRTKRPKQRIIMTHERDFFASLHVVPPFDVGVNLKIQDDGICAGKKSSQLEHCNIQQEFLEDELFSHLRDLKEVRDGHHNIGDFGKFAEKCRTVLEHIFKRKYYFELEQEVRDHKSIRSFVEKLAEKHIGGFEEETKKQNFLRLCTDLHIELHDSGVQRSDGDARSIVKDFFDCLHAV